MARIAGTSADRPGNLFLPGRLVSIKPAPWHPGTRFKRFHAGEFRYAREISQGELKRPRLVEDERIAHIQIEKRKGLYSLHLLFPRDRDGITRRISTAVENVVRDVDGPQLCMRSH